MKTRQPVVAANEREVMVQLDGVEISLNVLEKDIAELESRLIPARSPCEPRATKEESKTSCDLSSNIELKKFRIDRLSDRISDILGDLQI